MRFCFSLCVAVVAVRSQILMGLFAIVRILFGAKNTALPMKMTELPLVVAVKDYR